ncbi:hypothetical protein T01_2074 [Trichinella spiralis]|uniref:Uncharacterized protein n=1 Tax=Trichinella spiralis TaxID=6334 RepID=A0A0V0ZDG2_TRISP|nr:hypothetical protein T01_2074 [Trichinella spiralis]
MSKLIYVGRELFANFYKFIPNAPDCVFVEICQKRETKIGL